jgi:hypothetical protein
VDVAAGVALLVAQAEAVADSWRITARSDTSSESSVTHPKFMVGCVRATTRASVPTFDQEPPRGSKVIRISGF